MPTITPTLVGIPVISNRLYTDALVPRNAGGWMWIGQYYTYPNTNPTEWLVMHLEDATYHIDVDSPFPPGNQGKYANTNFTITNQLRAPNGRVFFPATAGYLWYYDPNTEHVTLMSQLGSTVGLLYSAIFNHDGSTLYFGTLGSSKTSKLPWVMKIDPVTLVVTLICLVGSAGHTLNAYAYYIRADNGPQEWLYALVGEDIWDVVAVNVATGTQTVIATATVNAFATFTLRPEGWVVNLYTNYGLPSQTVQQMWLVDGVSYPYVPGYNPATLPFTPRDVTPYTNPLVNPPSIDTSLGAERLLWRANGSTGAYTENDFTLAYASPTPILSLQPLPDNSIFGMVQDYLGFWRYTPSTNTFTYFGPFSGVTEGNAHILANGKVYISGYPNGPLYRYDPTLPWQTAAGAGQNPKFLGHYSDGTTLSGVKHANCLSYSAVQNRIYMAGERDRTATGGSIGWYDEDTATFGGAFAGITTYTLSCQVLVLDTPGRVVLGASTDAALVIYDYNLTELERQTPIPGMTDTGFLRGTGEANVVLGISPGGQRAYRWNIITKVLLGTVDLSAFGAMLGESLYQDPSTFKVRVIIGTTLVEIDPLTLAVTNLGTLSLASPGRMAVSLAGGTQYFTSGAELLDVAGSPAMYDLAAGSGAVVLSAAPVTFAVGVARHLLAEGGVITITGTDDGAASGRALPAHVGVVSADGADAQLIASTDGSAFLSLPSPGGDGNGPGGAVNVGSLAPVKTISVAGSWPETQVPFITIEINNDIGATGTWTPIDSGQGGRVSTVTVAAKWMRQNVSNNRSGRPAAVSVGADRATITVQNLPAPAGTGAGGTIDTSGLAVFKTVQVGGVFQGAVAIEVSQDGVSGWGQVAALLGCGQVSIAMSTNFMRVRRGGVPDLFPGLPTINIAAADTATLIASVTHDDTLTGDGATTPLSVIAADGPSRVTLTNRSGQIAHAGVPVYASANESFALSDASNVDTVRVIGIAASDIADGASGKVCVRGPITLATSQWDAIAGTTGGLIPDTVYYLAIGGGLTDTPPASSGDSIVLCICAVTPTVAVIGIQPPILL